MDNEFNKTRTEEYGKTPSGPMTVSANSTVSEITHVDQYPESTSKKKNKKTAGNSSVNKLLRIVSSFAAVTAVAATVAVPTVSIKAEIVEYWATDTQIFYQLEVENTDNELKIVVYNDFTHRETVLTTEDFLDYSYMGVCENLKPNVKYTIAVRSNNGFGDTTITEQNLWTMKTEDMPKAELYSVEYECKCETDGYFYFTIDFVDDNYYWNYFYATLTDMYGAVAACEFDNPHEEQRIAVYGSADETDGLFGETATLNIYCISTETGEAVEKTLYSVVVEI